MSLSCASTSCESAGSSTRRPSSTLYSSPLAERFALLTIRIAEPAPPSDGVDVEVVARFAPREERGDLVPDRILKTQHWTDVERRRLVHAPVDTHIDDHTGLADTGDVETGKLFGGPRLSHLVPRVAQGIDHHAHRRGERIGVWVAGEEVDIFGRPRGDAVLTYRGSSSEGETGVRQGAKRNARHVALSPESVAHDTEDPQSSGNRASHISRTRRGSMRSGQTWSSNPLLSTARWSATVPSDNTAR
jgi:hypothetical protein